MLLPRLANRLQVAAPLIRVHLVDLFPDNHLDTLERYEVDLALLLIALAHRIAPSVSFEILHPPVRMVPAQLVQLWYHRSTSSLAHVWLRDQIADLLRPLWDARWGRTNKETLHFRSLFEARSNPKRAAHLFPVRRRDLSASGKTQAVDDAHSSCFRHFAAAPQHCSGAELTRWGQTNSSIGRTEGVHLP